MVRLPDFTITKPVEQWVNGYMVTEFTYAGVPFKLMQSFQRFSDDAEHTYLNLNWASSGDRFKPENRWVRDVYFPDFQCLLTVEAAVQMLHQMHKTFAAGVEQGHAERQKIIKEAIGL